MESPFSMDVDKTIPSQQPPPAQSSSEDNTSEADGSPMTDTGRVPVVAASPPSSASPLLFPESGDLTVEAEGEFRWTVRQYSEQGKRYSDCFHVGKYKWRVLIYPRGNEPHEGQALSLYVAIDGAEEIDWAVCAQLIIAVENPKNPAVCIAKYTQHRFNASESDWGFTAFCPLKTLNTGDSSTGHVPLLADDALTISVRIRVIRDDTGVLWHNFINYNSKKVTGYVGLANQGATCYMNSLLQSLFFTSAFCKAIYQIPTEGEAAHESSALALQRIFWRLQHSDLPVSTQELTRAFGWDTLESFVQSDVHEFTRVLIDELEERFKKTEAEGTIERLFRGKVRNVIKCLNVPYASTRTESFYDLQLTIKGVRTLEESFDSYVRAEMLEGDNKYHAEGFGLQDAKRYVEFETLPPVLHLHLERYAFDPHVMATVKINDRLEFPLQLNLDKYLAPDSPLRDQPQDYVLQSVFVHSGDSHGGHYYIFIRDPRQGENARWYRFDDTKVIPVSLREAVEDNFGGSVEESEPHVGMVTRMMSARGRADKYRRFTNAYMLVYIRQSDLADILAPVGEEDIPAHIAASIRAEEEAERVRREEKQQQMMMIKVDVFTDEDIAAHGGFDLFNLDNKNQAVTPHKTYRLRRDESLAKLKETVAADLKAEPSQLRFWSFAGRRNKTIRLDESISTSDESKTLAHFYHRLAPILTHLVLYAERVEAQAELPASVDMAAVYFKFYDPEHSKLQPVGIFHVRPSDPLETVYPRLREGLGLPRNVPLEFYEEIKPGRIEPLDARTTFADSQIQTGDIVCVQLANPILTSDVRFPKVSDYLRNVQESMRVSFQSMDGSDLGSTILSASTPYADILQAICGRLDAPASHIRLHLVDEFNEMTPLKNSSSSLSEALWSLPLPPNVTSEGITLACEVTTIPVDDLDSMKCIKLEYTDVRGVGAEAAVYVAQQDTPRTLYPRLPVEMREAVKEPIRIVETHNHRIIRDYHGEDSLGTLSESREAYIEGPVDADELDVPEGYKIISVMSYAGKDPSRVHSRPFRFLLIPGEPFSLTRARLLARMGVPPADAEKWTFSLVAYGRARLIPDEEVLAASNLGLHDQLGICRPDPSGRSTGTGPGSGVLSPSIERSIKIRSSSKSEK